MGFYAEQVFPRMVEHTLNNAEMGAVRAATLEGVTGDILEIGFGSGSNLPYYPAAVTRLAAVEPSGGMTAQAQQRIADWGGTLDLRHLAGERLPFGDAEFDTVVITLTLCTVDDMNAVLAEITRVLRPGGRMHFFEHVASTSPRARTWQDRLNPLNSVLACGCNLNRDAEGAIRASGLTIDTIEPARTPGPDWLAPLFPAIRGVALKPSV